MWTSLKNINIACEIVDVVTQDNQNKTETMEK